MTNRHFCQILILLLVKVSKQISEGAETFGKLKFHIKKTQTLKQQSLFKCKLFPVFFLQKKKNKN
jgi:hypothetical protein